MIKNKGIPLREGWVFRRGSIYLANLNPFRGSEQGGTRPVLVLQNNDGNYFSDTLIVAPITSVLKNKDLPTHCFIRWNRGFEMPSIVQLEQITTIDKSRIKSYLGHISKKQMQKVEDAIETSLGFEIPECMEAP